MEKLRSVQVLRAVAAVSVVCMHAYGSTVGNAPGRYQLGAAGVDLFFVISGFIMAKVSTGRTAGQFLLGRAWRIFPLWFLALAPWLFTQQFSRPQLAASLTLWPVYNDQFHLPVLGVGWTLSFEMVFYAALAIGLLTRLWLPLVMYAGCMVLAFTTDAMIFDFLGSPMAIEFLMGFVVAKLPKDLAVGTLAIGGALSIFIFAPHSLHYVQVVLNPEQVPFRLYLWGLPAALMLYGFVSGEQDFGKRFDFPVLLGDASYSIYLFHPLVVYGVGGHWLFKAMLAVAIGLLIHLTIERRLLPRRGDPALVPAPTG